MTVFQLKGGALYAHDVDVAHFARILRKTLKDLKAQAEATPAGKDPFELEQDQGLDLATMLLAKMRHHDARAAAKCPDVRNVAFQVGPIKPPHKFERPAIDAWFRGADLDISSLDREAVDRLVRSVAGTRGRAFPSTLPKRFGAQWQSRAIALFEQAVAARIPGKAEFIALVGGPGTGKTLLAQHMVRKRGGLWLDKGLARGDGNGVDYQPGEVLVYDTPAQLPALSATELKRSLNEIDSLREYVRRVRRPWQLKDEALQLALEQGARGAWTLGEPAVQFARPEEPRLTSWVREHPQVNLVVTSADDEALRASMGHWFEVEPTLSELDGKLNRSSFLSRLREWHGHADTTAIAEHWRRSADINWRRVHVVNLDTMSTYTLAGPGLAMEQGQRHTAAEVLAPAVAG